MNPFTIAFLGAKAIRAIGALKGGKAEAVANGLADVVDSVSGQPTSAQAQAISNHIRSLPPDAVVELKKLEVEMEKISAEREKNQLIAETSIAQAAQETARVEAQSTDEYVRRTRPRMARQSAAVTFSYGLVTGIVFPVVNAAAKFLDPAIELDLPPPNAAIAGTLFAPCLAYLGARSVDAFSKRGKT